MLGIANYTETKARVQAGQKYNYGLNEIFKSKMLSKFLKIRLDKQLIVMHGNRIRSVNKIQKNNLLVFKRKRILRKIFDICLHTNIWGHRIWNKKIKEFHCYSLA